MSKSNTSKKGLRIIIVGCGKVGINIAALAVLIMFGCHNPFMFNQSTLVLGYLLLYGYDVTGKSYQDVYKRQ